MTQPTYGFEFLRGQPTVLPAVKTDMASVYLVGVSEDAVGSFYPLGKTVAINSNDPFALAALGTGDLLTAVQLINAQLAPWQQAARIAVHRVPKGDSDAETIANMLGNQAAGTGIFGALRVPAALAFTPRLLMFAGGFTGKNITRAPDGVVVVQAAKFGGNTGTGLLTLAAPAFGVNRVPGVYKVRCKTAAANGGVFSVVDPNGNVLAEATVGAAYGAAQNHVKFTIADGATDFAVGDGFDITVAVTAGLMNASPLVAALPQIENALGAMGVVDGPNTDDPQDDIDFRETIASDHTVMVSFAVTPDGWAAGTFTAGAACVVGVGVAVDFQNGGIPSQSWANQPVQGITALKRYDSFSMTDGANTGQQLLNAGIGICQRGNIGDPAAPADAGFNLICFATCATNPEWQFLNVVRLRDYIHLNLMRFWRERVGKSNINVKTIQAVENDAIRFLRGLKSPIQHIIDFRVGVDPNALTPATIRAGGIRVYFKAEEASPLLLITADSERYPEALTDLIAQVAGETDELLT